MKPFKKHKIEYLSPSMINQFVECPALTMLKIMGITDGEAGPSAWRGTAVEKSLTNLAYKPDLEIGDLFENADNVFTDLTDNAVLQHCQ